MRRKDKGEYRMPIVQVVLVLLVVGVLLWAVTTYIPMDKTIKQIIRGVVIIAVIIWLLKVFGVWDQILNIRI